MIRNFKCRETQKIWNGYYSKKFPNNIQNRALRKLRQLESADDIINLKEPPSNHLEKLKGQRHRQMSIRINNQWRICFIWQNNEPWDVEIVDYH